MFKREALPSDGQDGAVVEPLQEKERQQEGEARVETPGSPDLRSPEPGLGPSELVVASWAVTAGSPYRDIVTDSVVDKAGNTYSWRVL